MYAVSNNDINSIVSLIQHHADINNIDTVCMCVCLCVCVCVFNFLFVFDATEHTHTHTLCVWHTDSFCPIIIITCTAIQTHILHVEYIMFQMTLFDVCVSVESCQHALGNLTRANNNNARM